MSRLFTDPAKAEENFQILDQLKDANIWKILSCVIDPKTSFHQACSSRVRIKIHAQMLLSLDFLYSEFEIYHICYFLSMLCILRWLSFHLQDDLLRILGEKHRLYDFLGTLSLKCSYLLFNKEHVKEFLLEAALQKSSGNTQYIQSCMNILVVKDIFFLDLLLLKS